MKVPPPKPDVMMTPVPGYPTEGSSAPGGNSLVVRRVSAEDKARLRSCSVENAGVNWLQATLFKKEALWPRELYVKVLGCKGLAPPTAPDIYQAPDGSTTTTASNSTAISVSYVTAAGVTGSSVPGAALSPCRARVWTGDVWSSGGTEGRERTASLSSFPTGPVFPADVEEPHGGEQGHQPQEHESELEASARAGRVRFGSLDVGVGDIGVPPQRRAASLSAGGLVGRERLTLSAEEDSVDDEEDEGFGGRPEKLCGVSERELDWLVRVTNTTTGNDLYTKSVWGGVDPSFGDAFVVPCQGPLDAVVLGVYGGVGIGGGGGFGATGQMDDSTLVGEAVISLDARFIGASHCLLCKLSDSWGRTRGFIRIEAFWVDEAKPRKETGDFYYKVVHPGGVSLREFPYPQSPKLLHVMRPGEVFRACERQQHAGDDDLFVRVSASTDRWTRSGWCFEALGNDDGPRQAVLERVPAPKKEHGKFFFRVSSPRGVRLHSRANVHSALRDEVIPVGTLLESTEIYTPAGSPVSFVTVDVNRGYFMIKCGEKVVKSKTGELALERVCNPDGVLVSAHGSGDGVPAPPPPIPQSLPEAQEGARAEPIEANADSSTPSTTTNVSLASAPVSSGSILLSTPGETLPTSTAAAELDRSSSSGGSVPPGLAAFEAAAAARAVRERLYRVRSSAGAPVTTAPDIASETVALIPSKEAFHGTAEVVRRYEGLGEVAFIRHASNGLWVRANRPGMILLEIVMDRVEAGAFTYRVSHENGVVVRTAPGLDAPIERPRRILPVTKLINVCERLVRAEDIVSLSRPPIFLRLAGNDGWVFDRRGHTLVCEDVTDKARIATAKAITAAAEAARTVRLR